MSIVSGLPPTRITIRGKFWDSQIYSGTLYLFERDGSISKFDWPRFIDSLPIPSELRLVADAALLGSSRFYSSDVLRVIQDPEIQPLIVSKFVRLETLLRGIQFDTTPFHTQTDNTFPFPHNDSDVHYGSLYVGSRSGVFAANTTEIQNNLPARQLTDLPALDIATKHATIAVAGGTEGLFEIRASRYRSLDVRSVVKRACSTCEWTYASIVGSDHGRDLFVAAYSLVREDASNSRNRKKVRQFDRVFTDESLFSSHAALSTIEWGAKDRLYRYADGNFDVVQNTSNGTPSFQRLDPIRTTIDFDLDTFVAVRVAPFGSVLEFDDHIVALLNTGEIVRFDGEPVNWRVFPRSLNYLNHLHVIYENHMEIIAFTSDYFVSSDARTYGTEPISADERL